MRFDIIGDGTQGISSCKQNSVKIFITHLENILLKCESLLNVREGQTIGHQVYEEVLGMRAVRHALCALWVVYFRGAVPFAI